VTAGPATGPATVEGSGPAVDAAQVESFARDGHVLVPSLASPSEAASHRPVIEAAALRTAWDTRPLEERDTYGRAFLQSFNLWRLDPVIARFVHAERFARTAAALLGVEHVRLYHDQALCKEPGGGRTPWHQDQYYWPMDTDRTVTMWMPLVDVPAEIGTMTFASGSHLLGDLRGHAISDASDAEFANLVEDRALPTCTYGAVRAGDATFHAGWTIHSAGANPTDLLRTVMTVIYVADGARVLPQLTEAQDLDRRVWLGGTEPGALIDGELNPRLC
jgi:ectoine hydroxylase-related dioxygenase (phytanoyl-CoA dioxygenase family)